MSCRRSSKPEHERELGMARRAEKLPADAPIETVRLDAATSHGRSHERGDAPVVVAPQRLATERARWLYLRLVRDGKIKPEI